VRERKVNNLYVDDRLSEKPEMEMSGKKAEERW